jgi:hypothetical protein
MFPKPLKETLGPSKKFSKLRGDIHKSSCTAGVNYNSGKFSTGINMTTAANFVTGTAGVVDTDGKFAAGVNNNGGK